MPGPGTPASDDAVVRAFARPLAHELGNLLQVISGNLELLETRTSDEVALRYLGNARAAVDQLTEVARRLPVDPPD